MSEPQVRDTSARKAGYLTGLAGAIAADLVVLVSFGVVAVIASVADHKRSRQNQAIVLVGACLLVGFAPEASSVRRGSHGLA